ncbi:hypothetical protein RFI_03151 [Reticulomyxa filosa]|uniref:Endonuclease/exonuclease/phosphatase domain-containing protein n=1 Tax=Reticulomyxa filosa TaxID=46433 RepID=X6P6Y3_RETFI|nr:hypothetical protein RFI_03151 [Reticulomyxa filosa]|eukprot:ETO33946.1 hypothetical protein RFI_03151 [Reticulomyxa filosa]
MYTKKKMHSTILEGCFKNLKKNICKIKYQYTEFELKMCKQTRCCVWFKFIFCLIQFVFLSLMILLETLAFVLTYVVTFGWHYYKSDWKYYTVLKELDRAGRDTNKRDSASMNSEESGNELLISHLNGKERKSEKTTKKEGRNPRTLRVLTQNLWVHHLTPSPWKQERMEAFVRYLRENANRYDVLLLQEIFAVRYGLWVKAQEVIMLCRELQKIGFQYTSKPFGVLPYFGQNGGVLIASKYPIVWSDTVAYHQSDEYMLRKGFAMALIEIPQETADNTIQTHHILCVSAHCDPYRTQIIKAQIQHIGDHLKFAIKNSANGSPSFDKDDTDKKVVEMTKLSQSTSDNGTDKQDNIDKRRVIVGGDFNTRSQDLLVSLPLILQRNVKALWNSWDLLNNKKRLWKQSRYNASYDSGHCLDHILTDFQNEHVLHVGVEDTRHRKVFVSDHLGVEVELNLI